MKTGQTMFPTLLLEKLVLFEFGGRKLVVQTFEFLIDLAHHAFLI